MDARLIGGRSLSTGLGMRVSIDGTDTVLLRFRDRPGSILNVNRDSLGWRFRVGKMDEGEARKDDGGEGEVLSCHDCDGSLRAAGWCGEFGPSSTCVRWMSRSDNVNLLPDTEWCMNWTSGMDHPSSLSIEGMMCVNARRWYWGSIRICPTIRGLRLTVVIGVTRKRRISPPSHPPLPMRVKVMRPVVQPLKTPRSGPARTWTTVGFVGLLLGVASFANDG